MLLIANRRKFNRRCGVAVVIVLALLSMTLALSFAMLRIQTSSSLIHHNLSRQADARQAALSGLSAGIRRMHDADWPGMSGTFTRQLDDHESFQVQYVAGDAYLLEGDPDYAEKPFRVTVVSTGYALDPLNPAIRSEYTLRAVMQLVRRKLQSSPAEWQAAQGHSVYSFGTGNNYVEAPCQMSGSVFINGDLNLCEDWESVKRPFYGLIDEVAIYNRALTGLEILTMQTAGNSSNTQVLLGMNQIGMEHWWRFNESSDAATAVDSHGTADGTYAGGTLPGITVSADNRAVFLDGLTGRVMLGGLNLPNADSFSIAAWVAPFRVTGDQDQSRIISKAMGVNDRDHTFMLALWNQSGSGQPWIRLQTDLGFISQHQSATMFQTAAWNLVVMTYDSEEAEAKIYLQGQEVDSADIEGDVLTDSTIMTWIGDNPPGSARTRLLEDFKRLFDSSGTDYRPVSGDVTLSSDRAGISTFLSLTKQLGCNGTYQSTSASAPYNANSSVTTYRLFPGGPEYTIEHVHGILANTRLVPDADTNPLGIFRTDQSIELNAQVEIQGTLIVQGSGADLEFSGTGITCQGLDLPEISGDSTTYQLPVCIVPDDLKAQKGSSSDVTGAVVVFDSFTFESKQTPDRFILEGQAFAKTFNLQAQSDWETAALNSTSLYSDFAANTLRSDHDANFATWLETENEVTLTDSLRLGAAPQPVTYELLDLNQPIYEIGDGDVGLVWQLVRWIDAGGT